MAWADPLPGGGFRGGYRDPTDPKHKKIYVTDNGAPFRRKRDAKEAAEEAAAKARRTAAVSAGTLPPTTTWGEWWDVIVAKREFHDTDTARIEASIVKNHIRKRWGDVPLNEISHADAQDWVDTALAIRAGMSPEHARKIFGLFATTMRIAVKKRILLATPLVGMELPSIPKRPKPYLSVSSSNALDEHLREDYADAKKFGMETGLRPGEICGLHADRIDRQRGWMLVSEVFVGRKAVIRPFPKDKDARMVPLTDAAIEIIDRRLAGRELLNGCGVPHTDGVRCSGALVFLTVRGKAMRPNGLLRAMDKAAAEAKVPRRTPYAIRRGWATRAAEGGLDAFQIAEILGHATLEQAQEYVQQTPAARMKLMTALAKYPQLTVIKGGLGKGENSGADRGAEITDMGLDQTGPGVTETGS